VERSTKDTWDGPSPGPGSLPSPVLWLAWIGSRALTLTVFFALSDRVRSTPQGDIALYWLWASSEGSGARPVELSEYPGLARLVIDAVAQTGSQLSFAVAWVMIMLLVDAAVFVHLHRMDIRSGGLWLGGAALLGPVTWLRLELLLSALVVLAVSLRLPGPARSGLLLGSAVLLKAWPLVLVPVVGIGHRMTRWAAAFTATLITGFGVEAAIRGRDVLDPLIWQSQRGVQIESLLATPAWLRGLQGFDVNVETASRSLQLVDSPAWVESAALGVLAGLVVVATVRLWRSRGDAVIDRGTWLASQSVVAATVAVAAVATNKVFSTQYVLWFLPLVALALPYLRWRALTTILTLTVSLLSHAVYPYLYENLLSGGSLAPVVLVLRNALVLALLVVMVLEAWRVTSRHARQPPVGPTGD
jgi:hypothetical protein